MFLSQPRAEGRTNGDNELGILASRFGSLFPVASAFVRSVAVESFDAFFECWVKQELVLLEVLAESHRLPDDFAQDALNSAGRLGDGSACVGFRPRRESIDCEAKMAGGGELLVTRKNLDRACDRTLEGFLAPHDDLAVLE